MNLKFLLLCYLILFSQEAIGQIKKSKSQRMENKFAYKDCGCDIKVNLRIFNGLNDQGNPGPFGGNEVSDDDEESPGAITIANFNDTDGDGKNDNVDMDGVIASSTGRDELDLMKLIIEDSGEIPPDCTEKIKLVLSSNIKL